MNLVTWEPALQIGLELACAPPHAAGKTVPGTRRSASAYGLARPGDVRSGSLLLSSLGSYLPASTSHGTICESSAGRLKHLPITDEDIDR